MITLRGPAAFAALRVLLDVDRGVGRLQGLRVRLHRGELQQQLGLIRRFAGSLCICRGFPR